MRGVGLAEEAPTSSPDVGFEGTCPPWASTCPPRARREECQLVFVEGVGSVVGMASSEKSPGS